MQALLRAGATSTQATPSKKASQVIRRSIKLSSRFSFSLSIKLSADTCWTIAAGAVASGLCKWSDVDRALARTLRVRFQLGLFDDRDAQPLTTIGLNSIDAPESRALAADAARQSMTLLQRGELPFVPSAAMKLAVLGAKHALF